MVGGATTFSLVINTVVHIFYLLVPHGSGILIVLYYYYFTNTIGMRVSEAYDMSIYIYIRVA